MTDDLRQPLPSHLQVVDSTTSVDTVTSPAQPLDPPAVEAAKRLTEAGLLPAYGTNADTVEAPRIITNAYTEADHRNASSILYRKRIADLERASRSECDVRRQLVDVLSACKSATPTSFVSLRQLATEAMAAASELEKQDGSETNVQAPT